MLEGNDGWCECIASNIDEKHCNTLKWLLVIVIRCSFFFLRNIVIYFLLFILIKYLSYDVFIENESKNTLFSRKISQNGNLGMRNLDFPTKFHKMLIQELAAFIFALERFLQAS